MESVLGRYKNLIILVGVLFLQVLGLAVQVKRSGEAENTRLIRIWAVSAITPFERGVIWVQNGVSAIWHNYFYLRGVRTENRQLRDEIEQMRLEQVRLREDAAQAQRLQALLAFKEQVITKTVAAQVIGSSASDLSRIVYIDKGEDDGLKRDMAVITADGIVGKVLQVFPSVSQVLLINDQSSGVGVILEKTRLQGVLRGMTNGEVVLERVMSDEQVPTGEKVLTSGGDQIFPKGLPVGTVTKVTPGKDLFLNIRVKPMADLSRLEEVLVLVEKQERQAGPEVAGRVRAADILAQRLPSVPDKPPANAIPAGAATAKITAAGATAGAPGATGASPGTKPLQPSIDQPKPSQVRADQPKIDQPKTDQVRIDQPKPGTGSQNGSAIKPTTPASATKPATAGQVQNKSTGAGQPAAAGSVKPTTPKTSPATGNSATTPASTKPAETQAKPANAPDDGAATQPNPQPPQPPASDDGPH
jgi:rod shape-determining protein MreC